VPAKKPELFLIDSIHCNERYINISKYCEDVNVYRTVFDGGKIKKDGAKAPP
jgi:hypothetical protein